MNDSTIYQFLAYYPWVCILLGVYTLIVSGILFVGTLINLYKTLFRHQGFSFYYSIKFIIAGVITCHYYELFCDKDTTLPLILADQAQATLTMFLSLFIPVAILFISEIILSKMSPKETPLIENWAFKENLEKQWEAWIKQLKPRTSPKVSRRVGQYLALVIGEEKTTRQLIKRLLESEQFMVIEAESGAAGLSLAALNYPEVILLDVGLPDMEGSVVLERLREWTQTPVILLTVGSTGDENAERQNTDHTYYLDKPFKAGDLKELISSVLRHLHHNSQRRDDSVFQTPIFKLDRGTRVLTVRKKEVHLTPQEYHLLAFLTTHAGQVVTKKMINHEFWGRHIDDEGLRRYIHQLRYKIEYDPVMPKYILTEPGEGYRLKHR